MEGIAITINVISSFLSRFLSDEHIYDVFRTLKLPNVSLGYIKLVYMF